MELGQVEHERISTRLLVETWLIFLSLCAAQVLLARCVSPLRLALAVPLLLCQGLWLDRMYTVAHEGVHRKLFPRRRLLNDVLSSLLLWPILAPLTIFRKIHAFHHGQNRRDPRTAALDTFVVRGVLGPGRRMYYFGAWIFCVFMGGFFLHTLVSFVIFLFVPTRVPEQAR